MPFPRKKKQIGLVLLVLGIFLIGIGAFSYLGQGSKIFTVLGVALEGEDIIKFSTQGAGGIPSKYFLPTDSITVWTYGIDSPECNGLLQQIQIGTGNQPSEATRIKLIEQTNAPIDTGKTAVELFNYDVGIWSNSKVNILYADLGSYPVGEYWVTGRFNCWLMWREGNSPITFNVVNEIPQSVPIESNPTQPVNPDPSDTSSTTSNGTTTPYTSKQSADTSITTVVTQEDNTIAYVSGGI